MGFQYGGSDVLNPQWNGTPIQRVQRNGVTIWERQVTAYLHGVHTNFNLHSWILSNTNWNGTDVLNARITVANPSQAASFYSSNPLIAALWVPLNSFPVGSHIEMVWEGLVNIRAAGGYGGEVTGAPQPGGRGGTAIRVTGSSNRTLVMDFGGFTGNVSGGGGGGGAASGTFNPGGDAPPQPIRTGGGGGAGDVPGPGGSASGATVNIGGQPGTVTAGGDPGTFSSSTVRGGHGGNRGQPGGNGVSSSGPTSSGGAAGYSFTGRNRITLRNASNVDTHGPIQSGP